VGGVDRVRGRRITHCAFPHQRQAVVLSLHEDESGRLWAGTTAGLLYRADTGFVPVSAPDGRALDRVVAMADSLGALWVADTRLGPFRILRDRVEAQPGFISTPGGIFELSTDREGGVWIGYFRGGISMARGGAHQFFGTESGLGGGSVQAIYQGTRGGVWVGTGEGLSRYRNGRWTNWGPRQGLQRGVQGITAIGNKELWLLTAAGLLRLDMAQLENTPDSEPRNLSFRVYGPLDGIRFSETRRMVNPRMTQSANGRIWISTDDGLWSIDPNHLGKNAQPPPVRIEQVRVDGRDLDISTGASEFRGRELEIELAALSLGMPRGVDMRYRLEGFEEDWHSTVSPVRIVYRALAPGLYRFRAVASSPEGTWGDAGASIELRKAPEFYQTTLFKGVCVLALAGVIYALHRFRLGVLQTRFRAVLSERARIARELHDTLLQGFAGSVYLMKGACLQLETSPEGGKERLNDAISKANLSLKEARQALFCLRLPELENQTFVDALEASGKAIVSGTPIQFRMEVSGHVRQLPYETEVNLFAIARECMSNSMSHAQPAHIGLKLAYSPGQIQMSIEDDGTGFDVQDGMARKNHWGLKGVQERAEAIHANVKLSSELGSGTQIEIVALLRDMRHREDRRHRASER
jgi:two-component sensor histidine kinase